MKKPIEVALKKLGSTMQMGVRNYSSTGPRRDALTYMNAYPHIFTGLTPQEHIMSNHRDFCSKLDAVNSAIFPSATDNESVRALYAGIKGINFTCPVKQAQCESNHQSLKKKINDIVVPYVEEVLAEGGDPDQVHYLVRECQKFAARGQMVKNGNFDTLNRIHQDSAERYGNPVGQPYDVIKASGKDMKESAGRKRDAKQLEEDLARGQPDKEGSSQFKMP